jgi:transcriptional regulator with XRE-family HTH domain
MMPQQMYSMVLGRVVAYLRQQRGWNQGELADRVHSTQSTLSRVERGEVLPDALLFRELAEAFGMTADGLHEKVDAATQKAEAMAKIASPSVSKKKGDWWGAALAVVGAVGLIALVGAAVAALMGDEKK